MSWAQIAQIGLGAVGAGANAYYGKKASDAQKVGFNQAINTYKDNFATQEENLSPYAKYGAESRERINSLTNDPNAQINYVQNNPFFQNQLKNANQNLLKYASAGGSESSGETKARALKIGLDLGQQLLQTGIDRNRYLADSGYNVQSGIEGYRQNMADNVASGQIGIAGAEAEKQLNYGRSINQFTGSTSGALGGGQAGGQGGLGRQAGGQSQQGGYNLVPYQSQNPQSPFYNQPNNRQIQSFNYIN